MDAAWGWSALFALGLVVPSTMMSLHQDVGWWWVIVSPIPLVAWLGAWLIMGNASRPLRVVMTCCVGMIVAGMMWFGIHGILTDAHAQTPPTINGNCNAIGNNNSNCSQINVGVVPRRLTPDQMRAFSTALANSGASGSVEVLTDLMACPDCDGFAKQFEAVLRAAPGLKITPIRNGMTMLGYKGVALGVREIDHPPASAIAIVNAFRSLGANLTMVQETPQGDSESVFHIAQPNIP